MFNCLSVGGRCAVIVPEGVLFGNSNAHKSIKKLLLEKCRLDAVISMPSGIFKPYAGVSTAVLYFTKGEPTEKVWFYSMEADGYSLDDKRTEQPDRNDIPDILERFEKRSKEDNESRFEKHFFVPIEEIKEKDWDLSINRYKKEKEKEVNYRGSKIIIEEAEKEVKELLEEFTELKDILKNEDKRDLQRE
jgi:type I restriction enzyme M protein